MPSEERPDKSVLYSIIDNYIFEKRSSGELQSKFLTIIEFIDKFNLLPTGLYPVQKFVLKLYYNIKLDDTLPEKVSDRIRITDKFNTKVLAEMTEVQYLKYLYEQGRCNIKQQDLDHPRKELILVVGRRSGKSMMSSIISAYELYKLLARGNPQKYYGIPSSSEIRIVCVANDKDQASIVYGDMAGYVENIEYFKSSIVNDTQTYMKFQTDHDKKVYGPGGKSSITATFKSSIAKGLRGRGVITFVLDEIAFFVNDGKSSAEQVYRAMNPSLAQFSPKGDDGRTPMGPSDGRAISISSPDAKAGFFYNLYQKALSNSKGSQNMLMIQAPTWEVNPTLSSDYYINEYEKDPNSFMVEFGARFSDRVRGWIEDEKDLMLCVDKNHRPVNYGDHNSAYFAGIDFALVNDGTAISLFRFHDKKLELAYHEVWYAKIPWKESNPHLDKPIVPYANLLGNLNRLDIIEIVNWIKQLSKRFYIQEGIFDQWAGPVFESELMKVGIDQIKMKHFSAYESASMYNDFKMFIIGEKIRLYDWPIIENNVDGSSLHSPLITELLELQATSIGKNMYSIEAPGVVGKHDDVSDSMARGVYLASQHLSENPNLMEFGGLRQPNNRGVTPHMTYRSYHNRRRQLHGPVKYRSIK